jgi:hypothetical protein
MTIKISHTLTSIAATLALAGLSQGAFAAQPLITDDTGTQGTGGNQLEFGLTEDKAVQGTKTTKTHTVPLTYTRGITDTLDLFVSANSMRIRSTDTTANAQGSGNPSFGGKWRFYENEDSKTSFGFKQEVRLPINVAKERLALGVAKTSYSSTFIVTQEVPFGAIHANLWSSRDRYEDLTVNPNASTTRFSVAPVWEVTEQFKLALDAGTETKRTNAATTRTRIGEIGAIYSPSKELDFALGFIRKTDNATSQTVTNSVTGGVTWRFK